MNQFERTALLIGEEGLNKLKESNVIVFGIGGVGGYVVEALARSGVGRFDLVDNDIVCESNINRQIIATYHTIGMYKTEAMVERIKSINPDADVKVHNCFYLPNTANQFEFEKYDYIVDAVDTVTAKLDIITRAKQSNVPIISSMGAGNKLDPSRFCVADISKTSVCPLARVMRRELGKRGINHVKVVYSKEKAIAVPGQDGSQRKVTPGSIAFVPSVVGLLLASEIVKDILDGSKDE